ncbi:MAG: PilN domain-containing protein [Pirellulales bacterium]
MKTSINLLPASYQRQLVIRRRAYQWGAVLGVGLLIGAAVRWSDVRENYVIARRLELLTREHQPTQIMLKQLVDMRRELGELQQLAHIAQELEFQRPALSLIGLLSEIGEKAGGRLRVTRMDLTGLQQPGPDGKAEAPNATGSGVTLTGVSLDNPSVAKLVTGLDESGFFARTYLVKSKELGDEENSLREYEVRGEF